MNTQNNEAKHTARFPWLANGSTYFTDEAGNRVCTGSMMGRRNIIPTDAETVSKVHLRRFPMSSCGVYDRGGAYWGFGTPLYCAWGDSETERAEIFLRAKSRADARAQTLAVFPKAKFYR